MLKTTTAVCLTLSKPGHRISATPLYPLVLLLLGFGEWLILWNFLDGLKLNSTPKFHIHPGHGTNVTCLVVLEQLRPGFKLAMLPKRKGTLTKMLCKRLQHLVSVSFFISAEWALFTQLFLDGHYTHKPQFHPGNQWHQCYLSVSAQPSWSGVQMSSFGIEEL